MIPNTANPTVFLNGEFVSLEAARISPLDRGFLFGDGIYEVIPCYNGRMVGFERHMARLQQGLDTLKLPNPLPKENWHDALLQLSEEARDTHLGLYLQITRGSHPIRAHRYPEADAPTLFAYAFPVTAPSDGDAATVKSYRVVTGTDQRWQRCHIKSVALLGNVMHMNEATEQGADEILLYNERDELTEAAACNVFVVTAGTISTPNLDHQKLPGVTRAMLLDMLRDSGHQAVEERPISRDEVLAADEVWLTSATKEVAPVTAIDGQKVGDGRPGPAWESAQKLFASQRYAY